MTCPICSHPMPATLTNGRPRKVCSRACARQTRWHGNRDIDDMAVIRILANDPPSTTTRSERMAAVQVLTTQGRSASWIADQMHVAERSVTRYRSENRREAVK